MSTDITHIIEFVCRWNLPLDIQWIIVIYLNGYEGTPIIDINCDLNKTLLIASSDKIKPSKCNLIDIWSVRQYFCDNNPTQHVFCNLMKQKYNSTTAASVKAYRYLIKLKKYPEGQIAKGDYKWKQKQSDNKNLKKVIVAQLFSKSDIILFRNMFRLDQDEMVYYWLNVDIH